MYTQNENPAYVTQLEISMRRRDSHVGFELRDTVQRALVSKPFRTVAGRSAIWGFGMFGTKWIPKTLTVTKCGGP